MGKVLLNGREPVARELPETVAKRSQPADDYWRDLLAGRLTGEPPEPAASRPVTDIVWEFR